MRLWLLLPMLLLTACDDLIDAIDPGSRCEIDGDLLTCEYETTRIGSALFGRDVHWQVPLGTAPAEGWPVVMVFQGSIAAPELNWTAVRDGVAGWWYQGLLTKLLLDAGYAVVTPEAHVRGLTFWDTNVPPWSLLWETSPDHDFMLEIFDAIDQGTWGPLNGQRLYATGISSGGYMSSRMAVAYPDRMRAIAVHSGSYATCSGPLCVVPDLPTDHAPTLLLHGELDLIVPAFTMRWYADALADAGIAHDVLTDPVATHEWFEASPDAIVAWFMAHP